MLLCHKCQRILNRTLNRVKSKFIGSKISQLKKIKISSNKKITESSLSFVLTLIGLVVSIMTLRPNLYAIESNLEFSNVLILQQIKTFFCTIYSFTAPKIDINVDQLSLCGIILNINLLNRSKIRFQTISSLLLW